MTRQEAWTLLNEHTESDSLVRHLSNVIAAMQRVSGELGFA